MLTSGLESEAELTLIMTRGKFQVEVSQQEKLS